MNEEITVQVTFEIDDDMIEQIIDSAGSGIAYWAVTATDYSEQRVYAVTEHAQRRGVARQTHRISYETLARTFVRIAVGQLEVREDIAFCVRRALFENDPGDVDSEMADCIVQYAIFKELMFG